MMEKRYNYFYKITNNLNGHYYYGVHCTNNLDDGYMGSGKRLHYAYEKYGIENFTKEILKFFETQDSAFQYEYDFITEEMLEAKECYNMIQGGRGKGAPHPKNKNKTTYVDCEGNTYYVSNTDPRVLSGELHGLSYGKTITDTHKQKVIDWHKNNDTSGKNNSQYGWKCFYKEIDGQFINKRVSPEDIDKYISDGWVVGSKYKSDEEKKRNKMERIKSHKVCRICGQTNCQNPFCKVHNRILHLQHLIEFFDYDESKIGTLDAESEFNRVRNNLLSLKEGGKSNKDILNLYGNKTYRMDRTWRILK